MQIFVNTLFCFLCSSIHPFYISVFVCVENLHWMNTSNKSIVTNVLCTLFCCFRFQNWRNIFMFERMCVCEHVKTNRIIKSFFRSCCRCFSSQMFFFCFQFSISAWIMRRVIFFGLFYSISPEFSSRYCLVSVETNSWCDLFSYPCKPEWIFSWLPCAVVFSTHCNEIYEHFIFQRKSLKPFSKEFWKIHLVKRFSRKISFDITLKIYSHFICPPSYTKYTDTQNKKKLGEANKTRKVESFWCGAFDKLLKFYWCRF